jgi:hypothetical protein
MIEAGARKQAKRKPAKKEARHKQWHGSAHDPQQTPCRFAFAMSSQSTNRFLVWMLIEK